ncbi:MAG: DUF1593 domain-containing protein [Bacteroidales bacterium]|nr:DUF1593 domain-containing protein [Bacteroidales bacterium]
MKRLLLLVACGVMTFCLSACRQEAEPARPRVLVSTDIGGPDEDDFQSMGHLLMFNDLFDLEGLVSSPSFGGGSVRPILHLIDLYAEDFSGGGYRSSDSLKALVHQGVDRLAPAAGYRVSTDGSDWIVRCARKPDPRPLYVLVWGGLEDLAQALHDAPDIAGKLRVYWIGGPNKKFSPDAYSYIVSHFPDLHFIENNASYRGFIHNDRRESAFGRDFYEKHMKGTSALADDFVAHCGGIVRMGDTPSVLYMQNYREMDPENPGAEHWGGRFERMTHSSRRVFDRPLTVRDTVPVFSIVEMHLRGPVRPQDTGEACFTLHCLGQDWDGYYLGDGRYQVRYAPKAAGVVPYTIDGAVEQSGTFVVDNHWPGNPHPDDWTVGENWWTDVQDPDEFEDVHQGAQTVARWRDAALRVWADRCQNVK